MDVDPRSTKFRRRIAKLTTRTANAARGVGRRLDTKVTNPTVRDAVDTAASRYGSLRRAQSASVSIERLLLGGPDGQNAVDFARSSHNLAWPSTRLIAGPHVWLFQQIAAGNSTVEILRSESNPYVSFALGAIDAFGSYHGCTDRSDVHAFVARLVESFPVAGGDLADPTGHGATVPVLIRPIRDSSCYQVLDGHHRLAAAWVRGKTEATADVTLQTTTTPIQDCLGRMTWLRGEAELYQPVGAPELADRWRLSRRCTDRLEMMTGQLDELGVGPGNSYLDVASCYGWFVAEMAQLGYAAEGIEIDPVGVELGEIAYGLSPGRVGVGDAEQLLDFARRSWDVVSCFSFLHHLVIRKGDDAGHEFLAKLDRATSRVLIFDMGESREDGDRTRLVGWNPDDIEEKFRRYTTFTSIERLGIDSDDPDGTGRQFGRTLFACTREPVSS